MHILSVHNKYQIRGGEDESRESEERLLRKMGHIVDVYEEDNSRIAKIPLVNLAARTVWSNESYRIVKTRLVESKADIVHIQNFFPLISPSVYYAAKDLGVPVVQSLRNYTPVIASKIGAIAELVEHGRTGLHFVPGDSASLAATVEWALQHPDVLQKMRYSARAEFEAKYTAQKNYHRIMEIYSQVSGKKLDF